MKQTKKFIALCAVVLAIGASIASCQKEQSVTDPETPVVQVIHVDLEATVDATKAAYGNDKKVALEEGDALYVTLTPSTGATWTTATGTLTYGDSKFSGDLAVSGTFNGTDIIKESKDLAATFLPKGYAEVGYLSATGEATDSKAFYAGAKGASVPQLVHLTASVSDKADQSKSPLTLKPQNAVLCYSIAANTLSAGPHYVTVSNGTSSISGIVTATNNQATTFAVAFPVSDTETAKDYKLSTIGYDDITKNNTISKGLVANISASAIANNNPLPGVFSVSATKKVYFSKGNLKATKVPNPEIGTTYSWSFMEHQYSIVETNGQDIGGGYANANAIGLFGWGAAEMPYKTSTSVNDYTWSEWGNYTNLVNDLGSGWRTLTHDEWVYLINTRTVNGGKSYTLGKSVEGMMGMVLYPDNYTGSTYNGSDWPAFEAAGCVFLPAAGQRGGTDITDVGSVGSYWSSTRDQSVPVGNADVYYLGFTTSSVDLNSHVLRSVGRSVRLVQDL